MCGISAFLELSPKGSIDATSQRKEIQKELDESLDIIAHRGPDARGSWLSDDHRVGFGHVRLSIIDLSFTGNQPFHEGTNVHAVVNGELYDHELCREKLAKEYQFVGNSDCEIVMALYKHYGISCLSHLRGEFAFVLWDAKRQLLLAARDRYGIKSLYYTVINGFLLVATEMKSFLAFGWKPEWDIRTLRDQSWRVESKTYFRGVHRVLPGHYLIMRNGEDEGQRPYWDLDYPNKFTRELRCESEMIQGVRDHLLEAVKVRLKADVPVAVYLSGGLDSSSAAGMFEEDSGADESNVARRTAEWLGVDFHPVKMDETALASRFEDTVWNSEVPLPDLNGIARMGLAETVHAHGIKVVITGEGSDEHFAGYPSFKADGLCEPDYSWPASDFGRVEREEAVVKVRGEAGLGEFGERSTNIPASAKRVHQNVDVAGATERVGSLPFANWTDCFEAEQPEVRLIDGLSGAVRDAITKKLHPLHAGLYLNTKLFLPHFILRYNGDNVDMVSQVESRCPFLDHHLTEYVNGLPPSLKLQYDPSTKSFREKHILREAAKPFITEEIYNRTKKPFLGPQKFYPGGPLHQTIVRLVTK
ncbi:asparagine synthetase [Penicillium longicatenatum]|nr:asparagine synthetase [Penicillium longicatenatum]